jgi:hypothetical protein
MNTLEHAVGFRGSLAFALASLTTLAGLNAEAATVSRLPDEPIPLQTEGFPSRPDPILELGEDFLGTGTLAPGVELPTGAVWHPSFLLFGTLRSALQTFDDGEERFSEWANRLDLFGQLRLSGTERLIIGLRPVDQDGRFSGYNFEPDQDDGWRNELNLEVDRLFFEGDFGEIFPTLDEGDTKPLDVGFSVGRMPIFFQEGMLVNDNIDAVGVVRNSISIPGGSNLRATLLYGWNEINRDNNLEDDSASLFGLFTEFDLPCCTVDVDLVYVDGDDAGWFGGISSVQRIGHFNASVRALFSSAQDEENDRVSDGTLLFGELSWSPRGTHDNVYVNAFWGIDRFSSAARGPATGGPLGRTGILFAAVGLGRYGAALGNRADDSVGASVGYQWFLDGGLKQWIFEAGFREETDGPEQGAVAIGTRYQQAFGQHLVMRFDGFLADQDEGGNSNGLRVEALYKF